jgi:hypothetical protein
MVLRTQEGDVMSMEPRTDTTPLEPGRYEPPRVEILLTAEALEREILYAGGPSNPT